MGLPLSSYLRLLTNDFVFLYGGGGIKKGAVVLLGKSFFIVVFNFFASMPTMTDFVFPHTFFEMMSTFCHVCLKKIKFSFKISLVRRCKI